MKLILYFGHTGTTKEAAYQLKNLLADCEIYDGTLKNKMDFNQYDTIILGTNIRMGKPHKKFVKTIKKIRKQTKDIKINAFILAADLNQRSRYMSLIKQILPEDSYIGFFGGRLDPTHAKGLSRAVIKKCIYELENQRLPLPEIDELAIKDFVEHI